MAVLTCSNNRGRRGGNPLRQEKSGDPWQLRFIAKFYVTLPLNVLRGIEG